MRERQAKPRYCPEDGEEQCARVREPEVLVLLGRDPGEVPDGDRHRTEELTLGGSPHLVLEVAGGRVTSDDPEEEERAHSGAVTREERARDLDHRQDRED